MSDEIKAAVDKAVQAATDAMKGIEQIKTKYEGFETKTNSLAEKMDAFDQAEFKKIAASVETAVAASEEVKGKVAGLEAQQKALEAAYNRAPKGSDSEQKELQSKRNKLFNQFAKSKNSNKESFDEYVERAVANDPEFKSLSVGSNPDGGYTVLPEFAGIITTKVYESSPVRQLATVTTIGTDVWEVVTDNGEAGADWVGETSTRSETDTPTLGKIIIPVHEIAAEPRATQKIVDDSIIDIESWLVDKVSERFGRREATAFVSGNGVNKPRGLLSYTAGTDIAAGQIEQVNSTLAANFAYAGLVNLQSSLKEQYQGNATFLVKRASMADLMAIVDGIGRPIFNPMFDKNVGLEPMLMSRPVRFADDIEALGANALAAVYGDIRAAYQIVDRTGVRVLRDPYTTKGYIKFYTTKRVGGAVVNFEAIKIQKLSA